MPEAAPERTIEVRHPRAPEGGVTVDRDALYHAVLDDPDDDAPRLIYADWCEDNGEAGRAEFIRTQIERERLGEPAQHCNFGDVRNPRLLTPAEVRKREKLLARERDLWERHKQEWEA